MNRKSYTAMTVMAMTALTVGLYVIWHVLSRRPKEASTDIMLVLQTEKDCEPVPLATPVSLGAEDLEHAPHQEITLPEAVAAQPLVAARIATASPMSLVIEATPIPALYASLERQFPSARTIEPVEITSLADQLALRGSPSEPLQRLQLPVPHGRTVDVIIQQHRKINARRGTITGTVASIAHSEVIVSYAEEAMTASIIIPGCETMEIAYAGNGCHVLLDIDPAKILPNAPPLTPTIEINEEGSQ